MTSLTLLACMATLALALDLVAATDYCSSSLCPAGKKHIACGNKGNFLAKCPSNAAMVDLTPFKSTILSIHNAKRNLIAGGKITKFKPAARMATMQWDDELASVAAFNVKQCQMKHDACRNTATYSMSGQNLAQMSYSGKKGSQSTKYLVQNRVNAWFQEYKNAKMSQINSYPSGYNGPAIGHFTVFVADKNERLGCAASKWTSGKINNFLIACNYATTNIAGKPIYVASSKAASGCKTGKNSKYPNLCSTKESYNVFN